MMLRSVVRCVALVGALASAVLANPAETVAPVAAEQSAPAPAAAPHVGSWHPREVDGVEYLPLEDFRSFYKLMPMQPKGRRVVGQRMLGNGEVTLIFGPNPRELRIQDRLCMLSYPVLEDASGDMLVSKIDLLQVIEPVLRPTYIRNRSAVRTVVIDPGHGGHDAGTITSYVRESDVALLVARKLAADLQKRGYETLLTKEQNTYLSPQGRVDKANEASAAIFVSLHLNSGRSDYQGVQTYTLAPAAKNEKPLPGHEFGPSSMALAMALQSSLVEKADAQDGGCHRVRYSPLSSVRCPAVIVELGYATNPEEGTRLNTDEYQMKLASSLADGVDSFAKMVNPATNLHVQQAPVVETPPAPVKVTPAPVTKKAEPRKRAERRRAPVGKGKKRGR